jgi:NADPH:quinone reductase-like Zn-dependent oxidoreductase
MANMKAILIEKPGGPEMLKIRSFPIPGVLPGQVLIEVRAFGLNRAELYMREGKWPGIAEIIGIECAGLVAEDPEGRFKVGQKVVAFMGGMGRTINGSYAQFTSVPAENVIPVETVLDWARLASMPESFSTAWGILHWSLHVKKDQTILVRGATSALGQAVVILAKQAGLRVLATTRSKAKSQLLKNLGADEVIIDEGKIRKEVRERYPDGVDRVVELVGSTTMMDSTRAAAGTGIVCMAGFLGGRTFMDRFQSVVEKKIRQKGNRMGIKLPGLARIIFFAGSVFGSRHFPVDTIPFQQMLADLEESRMPSILAAAYRFEDIEMAHRMMESNERNGKIVVIL